MARFWRPSSRKRIESGSGSNSPLLARRRLSDYHRNGRGKQQKASWGGGIVNDNDITILIACVFFMGILFGVLIGKLFL